MRPNVAFLTLDMTGDQFLNRRRARNWAQAGAGMFGTALVKGRLAWKVQPHIRAGWGAWVTMCALGHIKGPFAPRVRVLVSLSCGGVAALMERLRPAPEVLPEFRDQDDVSEALRSAASGLRGLGRFNQHLIAQADIRWPGLAAFMRSLTVPLGGSRLDLHPGNFMFRRDGQLVLTDPIV